MDLSTTTQPRSDQLNADDLIGGPITVTIERVTEGAGEQPADFHTVETPGRCWRPSKGMRRVLIEAWGPDTDAYAGRQVTLYRDPGVRFGSDQVGGIRISHLSHIPRPLSMLITVTRSKRVTHTVEPIAKPTAAKTVTVTLDDVAACDNVDDLRVMWHQAAPEVQAAITARVAELKAVAS